MSIVIALIVFSILILIHEFGHFLLAKKNGICVTEFSLGMGPRIVSFVKGETRYSWKAIPFGGSCAMLGDGMDDSEHTDSDRAFENKGVWARISVIAAGPIFNFLLAIVLSLIFIGTMGVDIPDAAKIEEGSPAYEAGLRDGDRIIKYKGSGISVSREIFLQDYVDPTGSSSFEVEVKRDGERKTFTITPELRTKYMLGMSYSSSSSTAQITITEGGALEQAGFQTDDVLTAIDGTPIASGEELYAYLRDHALTKDPVEMTAKRGEETITKVVTPTESQYEYTGFGYNSSRSKVGSLGTIKYSFVEIKYQVKVVIKSLGRIFTGQFQKDDLAGPVGVVNIISDTVQENSSGGAWMVLLSIMNLTIMLSANLGMMNLLPIPALDGGRLVFLFIELIRGKPVPKEKEGMVHLVGMALLMVLMVFVLFNDISRLFR